MLKKKRYSSPQMNSVTVSFTNMIAWSIIEGASADPDSEVLVKENARDFWGQDKSDMPYDVNGDDQSWTEGY